MLFKAVGMVWYEIPTHLLKSAVQLKQNWFLFADEPLYVARIHVYGPFGFELLPGYFLPSRSSAFAGTQLKVYSKKHFALLVNCIAEWITVEKEIPSDAIEGDEIILRIQILDSLTIKSFVYFECRWANVWQCQIICVSSKDGRAFAYWQIRLTTSYMYCSIQRNWIWASQIWNLTL